MSRKKTQPKKNVTPDPKFKSTIIPKLINNIMYDGKRGVAAKIVYEAIEKIKTKTKDEPINIFNEAINNIKPTVEVRSRRVGGATYQVPVEVKSKRAQALAIRWLVESARKRKDKHMSDKIFNELYDATIGSDHLPYYAKEMRYHGGIIGPVANRIGGGRVRIGGMMHELERNQDRKHSLHSGRNSTHYQIWRLAEHGALVLCETVRITHFMANT